MLQVRDIMTPNPITVTPDTEVVQAARILLDKGINGLPVVAEGGRLAGIICQSDLINQQKKLPLPSFFTILDGLIPLKSVRRLESQVRKIAAATVSQAMTPEPVTVTPDTGIQEAAALMVDHGFNTLRVLEDGKLAGVVGKEDVLKTLLP